MSIPNNPCNKFKAMRLVPTTSGTWEGMHHIERIDGTEPFALWNASQQFYPTYDQDGKLCLEGPGNAPGAGGGKVRGYFTEAYDKTLQKTTIVAEAPTWCQPCISCWECSQTEEHVVTWQRKDVPVANSITLTFNYDDQCCYQAIPGKTLTLTRCTNRAAPLPADIACPTCDSWHPGYWSYGGMSIANFTMGDIVTGTLGKPRDCGVTHTGAFDNRTFAFAEADILCAVDTTVFPFRCSAWLYVTLLFWCGTCQLDDIMTQCLQIFDGPSGMIEDVYMGCAPLGNWDDMCGAFQQPINMGLHLVRSGNPYSRFYGITCGSWGWDVTITGHKAEGSASSLDRSVAVSDASELLTPPNPKPCGGCSRKIGQVTGTDLSNDNGIDHQTTLLETHVKGTK